MILQGRVYKARVSENGQVVAVKKYRASLTLKHTELNHERLILQRLQGNASIPKVLAYGRVEHFEYLAIELLGESLEATGNRCGPLPGVNVLAVAEQMVNSNIWDGFEI